MKYKKGRIHYVLLSDVLLESCLLALVERRDLQERRMPHVVSSERQLRRAFRECDYDYYCYHLVRSTLAQYVIYT